VLAADRDVVDIERSERLEPCSVDLTDGAQVAAMVDTCVERFGRLDRAFNGVRHACEQGYGTLDFGRSELAGRASGGSRPVGGRRGAVRLFDDRVERTAGDFRIRN
jgi:NAD(P)-dependent dehydrogenase (short-subunit alcohol dehydrogenase family)